MARPGRAEQLFRDVLGEPAGGFQTPGPGTRLSDGVGDWLGEVVDLDLSDAPRSLLGRPERSANGLADGVANRDARQDLGFAGMEFVAVYAPYSFFGGRWGIYFFDDGMYGLSVDLASDPVLARNPARVVSSLYRIVREHEWLHYRVELAAALTRPALSANPYPPYLGAYRCRSGTDCLEEAIATAVELREGRSIDARVTKGLDRLSAYLPAGYRNHASYRRKTALLAGQAALVTRLISGAGPVSGELLSRDLAVSLQTFVPVKLVSTGRVPPSFKGLLLARGRAKPTVTQVLAHANRNARVDKGGKHPYIVNVPGKRAVPIPVHSAMRTVPDEIIGQLARLFDLSRADYLAAVLGR